MGPKRNLIIVFLFTAFIFYLFPSHFAPAKTANGEKEWYPFSLSSDLDVKSPANIGRLVLEQPAGKHGFAQVKDGHFYFKDNTRARFWGTNLCLEACFPSKEEADLIARRLAFFGFNAVRLYKMDFGFPPRGVFKDITPRYHDPQLKITEVLSEEQLDRLDYLIYRLKKNGIYVSICLLAGRQFREADGIVDAESLSTAAKPVCMFDEELIALQKKYAKNLLTHQNKYTKLTYNNDPAIALIEIIDECSLIEYWKQDRLNGTFFGLKKDSIPDYYVKQLDILWNRWLLKKYGSLENVKQSWKSGKEKLPASVPVPGVKWALQTHDKAKAIVTTKDNTTTIKIRKVTDTPDDLQYKIPEISLSRGKQYLLSFTAAAGKEMKMEVICQQIFYPWENLGLSQEITVTPEGGIFTIPFMPTKDCESAKVGFVIGYEEGEITLRDLELKEINTLPIIANEERLSRFKFHRPLHKLLLFYSKKNQADIHQFYTELSTSYFKQIADFLRQECQIKIPVTGISGYTDPEDIVTQASCDYIDVHAFWDCPAFPHEPDDKNDFRLHNKSMLFDKNLGLIKTLHERSPQLLARKPLPYTVSEWNHCFPNQYAYETPPLLASIAVKNNLDGLFQFAFAHRLPKTDKLNFIDSYFDIIANPQQLLFCGVGSLTFHYPLDTQKIKGVCGFVAGKVMEAGPFSIKPEQDGALFLFSSDKKTVDESSNLVLVSLNEIKNKDSGWFNHKWFEWGKPPTLLKKINLTVEITTGREVDVYALDNKGSRGRKIRTERQGEKVIFSNQEIDSPWLEIILD